MQFLMPRELLCGPGIAGSAASVKRWRPVLPEAGLQHTPSICKSPVSICIWTLSNPAGAGRPHGL